MTFDFRLPACHRPTDSFERLAVAGRSTRCRGFGLVEMLIGASVLAVVLYGISNFFQTTLLASRSTQAQIQGDYLLEEGVEIAKHFRNASYADSFGKMSTSTAYYFSWDGANWATTTTSTLIDEKFERKFTIADVTRDANSDIAPSGTYDPDTKLITMSVSWWSGTATTTRSIQAYIMNIFTN